MNFTAFLFDLMYRKYIVIEEEKFNDVVELSLLLNNKKYYSCEDVYNEFRI